ncbi:DUF2169 domain-containing protein [Rhodopirellula sp. JC639]|uniref:DUF2169 domain-containing protein n=1 Tax=Stieleria mannarensis TaxID=2755585 RepID=UPI0016028B0F|nr:DUF2169 domain-containing protein [Rhodopirellula sp. JC639]
MNQSSSHATETDELPLATQVSGRSSNGDFILSVLAKRTYRWVDDHWHVDEEQEPLCGEPLANADHPALMERDSDLHPHKEKTDVIVKGHAYGDGRSAFLAGVDVNGHRMMIHVSGDRMADRTTTNRLYFSSPQPVEKVPLCFSRAYGGVDTLSEAKYGNPFLELADQYRGQEIDLEAASPFRYPRNAGGMGYLMELDPATFQPIPLPNLEAPSQLLTPETLTYGDIDQWPRMPLPAATDWVDYGMFPRNALMGFVPWFDPEIASVIEIEANYVPAEIWHEDFRGNPSTFIAGLNGAPLPLQLPHLTGGEQVMLRNIHPTHHQWGFTLPDEVPTLRTDGRQGKLNDTQAVIHTIVIHPDSGRLTTLWRGSAKALRPYLPEELERMPFEAIWN